ncbi:MAG: molybdopterin-dependent oxidoreductase [Chloroflexota bacterium]
MEEIRLTIDGKEVAGKRGDTILAVCERNGIDVPTLCHFKGLSDIGACRLCIVEIEGARALTTACTTPASSGMVVRTDTPALSSLRKQTLELLFAERNHFCMFCEMSGDCELQTLGYRFGITAVRYTYMNPSLEIDSSSPYFVLDHNRCVLCRRCVRACGEMVGVNALGYRERGAKTMVNFDLDAPVAASTCEACGACVQVCPTGAFFDKRSAYKGRLKDCRRVETACQACSVGCQMQGIARGRTVLRVDGDYASEPTYGLLCARGRYEVLDTAKARILQPRVRTETEYVDTTWDEALDLVAARLSATKHVREGKGVAAVATAQASNEALYLLDWVFRGGFGAKVAVAGAEGASARAAALRRVTGGDVTAEASLSSVREADYVLLLDADPAKTHPVLAASLRRSAVRGGTRLAVIGDPLNGLIPHASVVMTPTRTGLGVLVNGLMRLILAETSAKDKPLGLASALHRYTPELVQNVAGVPSDLLTQVARGLASAARPLIVYGGAVLAEPDLVASVISLALLLGKTDRGTLPSLGLAEGTNGVVAARLAGSRTVRDVAKAQAVFVALGDADGNALAAELAEVGFLAVHAAYPSALTERADVVLPAPTWAERQGTFVAGDGTPRRVARLVPAPAGVMDDLELIAALGARLGATASFTETALAAKVELAVAMRAANLDRAAPVCVSYL